MEIILGVFVTLIILVSIFNTLLLIGIAGSMAKLLKHLQGDQEGEDERARWIRIMKQRKTRSAQEGNDMNYADIAARLEPSNRTANWDGIPRSPNWDGIPKIEED